MNAHLFQLANIIALVDWIIMIGFPTWRYTSRGTLNGMILILCLFYYCLVLGWIGMAPKGGFDSLANVMLLFTSERAVLAGWIHYLAFDMFVGLWITLDAQRINLKRWILVPIQLLTFMLGPIGLGTYMIMRRTKTKEYLSGF
jgi:hypothetical protein